MLKAMNYLVLRVGIYCSCFINSGSFGLVQPSLDILTRLPISTSGVLQKVRLLCYTGRLMETPHVLF